MRRESLAVQQAREIVALIKETRPLPSGIDSEVALKIKERNMPPEYDDEKVCSNPYVDQARNLMSAAIGNGLSGPQTVPYQEEQPILQRLAHMEKSLDMALSELFSRVERIQAEVTRLKSVIGTK